MEFNFQEALNKVLTKIHEWFVTAIEMLPNLAVAILLMILFYFLARFSRYGLHQIDNRIKGNDAIMSLIGKIVFVAILGVGFFVALSVLQLDKAVTSLLAGAGIIGLALGFAFQETASNFLAGVIMAIRKPFRIGDMIETNDYMGIVQELSLRSTIVRTFRGQDVIIPNKTVYYNPITNFARYKKRRIDLQVGVSYGDDLEKVKEIALDALADVVSRDKSREIKVWFEEFGNSSINLTIALWVDTVTQASYRDSVSDMVMKIKKAFDDNDIMIPFPIRTLDFGIKGGEKLDEMKMRIANNGSDGERDDSTQSEAS